MMLLASLVLAGVRAGVVLQDTVLSQNAIPIQLGSGENKRELWMRIDLNGDNVRFVPQANCVPFVTCLDDSEEVEGSGIQFKLNGNEITTRFWRLGSAEPRDVAGVIGLGPRSPLVTSLMPTIEIVGQDTVLDLGKPGAMKGFRSLSLSSPHSVLWEITVKTFAFVSNRRFNSQDWRDERRVSFDLASLDTIMPYPCKFIRFNAAKKSIRMIVDSHSGRRYQECASRTRVGDTAWEMKFKDAKDVHFFHPIVWVEGPAREWYGQSFCPLSLIHPSEGGDVVLGNTLFSRYAVALDGVNRKIHMRSRKEGLWIKQHSRAIAPRLPLFGRGVCRQSDTVLKCVWKREDGSASERFYLLKATERSVTFGAMQNLRDTSIDPQLQDLPLKSSQVVKSETEIVLVAKVDRAGSNRLYRSSSGQTETFRIGFEYSSLPKNLISFE